MLGHTSAQRALKHHDTFRIFEGHAQLPLRSMGLVSMAVYVDNTKTSYGRMRMCHMLADTTDELLAMADHIGIARKWLQKAGTPQEHLDICMAKRVSAVRAGAVEITWRETALLIRRKRAALGVNATEQAIAALVAR